MSFLVGLSYRVIFVCLCRGLRPLRGAASVLLSGCPTGLFLLSLNCGHESLNVVHKINYPVGHLFRD